MPQAKITTDWICIATAGPTVDGRTIEAQWLHDAAETYSRNTYTAMIWPHHPMYELGEREFTCNLGEVDELRVEEVDDKTKLYAKLVPNQFLIEANRMGQKLFTSAEFWEDFGGSGREYLFGLAVTDIPASLGTEKITLVFDGEQYNGARGNIETFSLGKMKTNKPSMWGRLFSTRKNKTFATDNTQQGEDETKMEELRDLIEKMLNRIKALEDAATGETVDDPEAAAAEVGDLAEEIAEVADEVAELADEVAENPEDEVLAEEFSAARAKMAALTKRFSTQGTTEKSTRRGSRAGRRQGKRTTNLAAKQKGGKDGGLAELKGDMNEILKQFNALAGKSATKVPGKAPGGSEEPFEFL